MLSKIGGDEARDARLPMPSHLASPGALRRHRATLAVVGIYFLLAVVPGVVISLLGHRVTDQDFVKLSDWRELPGALMLYLLLAPVIWTFYLWQPRLILDVFAGLAEGGVVGAPRQKEYDPGSIPARGGGHPPQTGWFPLATPCESRGLVVRSSGRRIGARVAHLAANRRASI